MIPISLRPVLALITALTSLSTLYAQTKVLNAQAPKPTRTEKKPAKSASELEAERVLNERRANAQSLLISLAADARSFNDMVTRGRTLARIASVLWTVDRERSRTMFRQSWDAAEIADKEAADRAKTESRQLRSGFGQGYASSPEVRREIIRLTSRLEAALGEEFLTRLKEQMQRDNAGSITSSSTALGLFNPLVNQRLDAARQMLEADEVDRALQFADPVFNIVGQHTVDFLSSVRERNAVAADQRYANMLSSAATNPQSDANTVSVLSSYLFTPHIYIGYSREGTFTNSYRGNPTPPNVSPELRVAFFRSAGAILLRPLAPPGEEQTSAGHDGHYLVIKRLMSLFEQYAPSEVTAALRARLESLSPLVTKATRDRDDDNWVRQGIRPENEAESWETSLRDRLDRAKTSAERDQISIQLASMYASKGDLRSRDVVDGVADPETRNDAKRYIDIRLARHAVQVKDADRIVELIRIGEFDHLHKIWLLTQASLLLVKADSEKALSLTEQSLAEARRISSSEPDAARGFLCVANAVFAVERASVWEIMNEAVKSANAAEGFTGEDPLLQFRLAVKNGLTYQSVESVADFTLESIFKRLAEFDYEKAVQVARGINRDAPRSSATLAVARTVLATNRK